MHKEDRVFDTPLIMIIPLRSYRGRGEGALETFLILFCHQLCPDASFYRHSN